MDKAKNKFQQLTGKGKEQVGQVKGDDFLTAEGKNDQTKANLKGAGEKVKDAAHDVKHAGEQVKDAVKP
jgi:uncharacterized protein YjbJ (UPF0337 family)